MQETAQEYTKRMLGHTAGADPLRIQAATAKKLESFVRGVSLAKLRKRPAPGKWSASEIVAHLADVELAISWRIRQIISSPGVAIQGFDQDAWVASGHYDQRDPRKAVELFRAVRNANLALLKSLSPEQWKAHGVHSERGAESVEHIARMTAGHDVNHTQQLERILKPARATKK